MDFKQIQELVKLVSKSSISELTVEQESFKITIKRELSSPEVVPLIQASATVPVAAAPVSVSPAPAVAGPGASPAPKAEADKLLTIKSPMIGTFYRSPSPDKPLFVNVGDEVTPGKVVCIIEAMKLFNEIESEVSGRIVKILVEDASPVEYDQPLFLVDPS